jgi:hypothetical protein
MGHHRWAIDHKLPEAREAMDDLLDRSAAVVAEEKRAYREACGPLEQLRGTKVIVARGLGELDAAERTARVKAAPVSVRVNVDRSLIVD